MESYMPFPGNTAYATSKGAVESFSKALLVESKDLYPNIKVFSIHPGMVSTNIIMNSKQHIKDTRIGGKYRLKEPDQISNVLKFISPTTPKDAALQIVEGINNGNTRIIIGTDAKLFDYLVRLFPHFWFGYYSFKFAAIVVMLGSRFVGRKSLAFLFLIFFMLSKRFANFRTFLKSKLKIT